MKLRTVHCEIEGISPLLMHSANLVNPSSEIVQAIKAITSKHHSKITDDDKVELQRLEFLGGVYYDDEIGIYVPGVNVEGLLRDAAKSDRKGKATESGLEVEDAALVYDGPKDPHQLWDDGRFADIRSVVVNKGRVMRTRPMFRDWSLKFVVSLFSPEIRETDIPKWLERGGAFIGLGDYRPKFGRFLVRKAQAA